METDLLIPFWDLRADLKVPRCTPVATLVDHTDEKHLLLVQALRSLTLLSYSPISCLVAVSSPMDGLVLSIPTTKLALDLRKPPQAAWVDGADVVAGMISRLFGLDVPGAGVWQLAERESGMRMKIGSYSTRLSFDVPVDVKSPRHALAFCAAKALGWADAGLERTDHSVELPVATSVATSVVSRLPVDRCGCEESLHLRQIGLSLAGIARDALDLPSYSSSTLKSRLDEIRAFEKELKP